MTASPPQPVSTAPASENAPASELTGAANLPAGAPPAQPYNIEAEQGLLGALLIQNDVLDDIADFLDGQHFFDPLHQRLYSQIVRMISQGNLASVVTLKSTMAADEGLQSVGGDKYLAALYANAATLSNAKQYGQLIYDLALRRALMQLGSEIAAKAAVTELDLPPRAQIERAEYALYQLAEHGGRAEGFLPFAHSVTSAMDMIHNAYHSDAKLTGLSTGFADLDRVLGGLQKSDLLVIASRPGMGKTSLASNIAFHVAQTHARAQTDAQRKAEDSGAVVGFFSLEMSAEQLATRLLAEQIRVPSSKIRTGDLEPEEYENLLRATKELKDLPLYIDHTGAIPLPALAARARRLKRQKNLGLIIVDYLQLVRAHERRNDGRVQEISEITQGLKALAKDLRVPVIALSQLSRQVEAREDKRPQLSDLRESGAIEQDADVVLFIYREAYYLTHAAPAPDTPEYMQWQEKMQVVEGTAELLIGKNRHGPTPKIDLAFNAKLTRFRDLDERHDASAYATRPESEGAAAPGADAPLPSNERRDEEAQEDDV